jgi:hypothetical protein
LKCHSIHDRVLQKRCRVRDETFIHDCFLHHPRTLPKCNVNIRDEADLAISPLTGDPAAPNIRRHRHQDAGEPRDVQALELDEASMAHEAIAVQAKSGSFETPADHGNDRGHVGR